MIKVSRGSFGGEELEEIQAAFDYGYLGLGHKVDEFENALKKFLNASYVVATNTGTSALHLALEALEIKPGDEVITSPFSFFASLSSITKLSRLFITSSALSNGRLLLPVICTSVPGNALREPSLSVCLFKCVYAGNSKLRDRFLI